MTDTIRNELVCLADEELDLVAAGTGSLVNVSVPLQINVGVQFANQTNVAVFSIANQGGSQNFSLAQFNFQF